MSLALVRNRKAAVRAGKLVMGQPDLSTCVICKCDPCDIVCTVPAAGTAPFVTGEFVEAFDDCPNCIPETVRLTVTGMVPPTNEFVPLFVGGGAAPFVWVKCLNPPTSLDICLQLNTNLINTGSGEPILWYDRLYVPLPEPVEFEYYVDPFPIYDEDGKYVYDTERLEYLCTLTAEHFGGMFQLINETQPSGDHDWAQFLLFPCLSFTPDQLATLECSKEFTDGEDTRTITLVDFTYLTPYFVLESRSPTNGEHVNIVSSFCGETFTFEALTEATLRSYLAINGSEDPYPIDAQLPHVTFGGTVAIKPCCDVVTRETCGGAIAGPPVTWYRARLCSNNELTNVLALPDWVEFDGTAYFDGYKLQCIYFDVADTYEVDDYAFPWHVGYHPFYIPLATYESCENCADAATCSDVDNTVCNGGSGYSFVLTPGAACVGIISPRSGTLDPQGDGTTWKYSFVSGGVTLFCMEDAGTHYMYILLQDGSTSPATVIFWRKELGEDGCPQTGTYDYYSSSGDGSCDLSTFVASLL